MKEDIKNIIVKACDIEKELIQYDTLFLEELGIDSLVILEIIIELEIFFDIVFNVDEVIIEHDITINSLTKIIKKL